MISSGNYLQEHKPLTLLAKNLSDLNIISALAQDSVLKKKNIRWIKKRHRFSLLINRFKWEQVTKKMLKTVPFGRAQSMLRFDGVVGVVSLGVENALEDEILSLLRIDLIEKDNLNHIKLVFSGNIQIKLKIEFLSLVLQDFNEVSELNKGTIPNHEFGIDR